MSDTLSIRIASPAKVNLGLEILGKRDDGYHEIRSVLAMVDVYDDLVFTRTGESGPSRVSGMPEVADDANLILTAIRAFNQETGTETAWHVEVTKRIPAPAGLGGASSNAACTLLALNHATGDHLQHATLSSIAARLGSDVPFFLGSPAALVSGTGTDLAPVPPPSGWVLIAAPRFDIEAKTARLYGLLDPSDFSDGSRSKAVSTALSSGELPPSDQLGNAFLRPLASIAPSICRLRRDMQAAGIAAPLLTGAGPAHYAIFESEASAREAQKRLSNATQLEVVIFIAAFRARPVSVMELAR